MKPESMTEPADSPRVALRVALVGVAGPESTSDCGCRWKRVRDWHYRGATICGDVLTRFCPWHEWYSSLPVEQQREVAVQRRVEMRRLGRMPPHLEKEARARGLFS
jgi:hypothetical protein